jgi:hypothetical protein
MNNSYSHKSNSDYLSVIPNHHNNLDLINTNNSNTNNVNNTNNNVNTNDMNDTNNNVNTNDINNINNVNTNDMNNININNMNNTNKYNHLFDKTLSSTVKGIFLLLLTVASNYNAETLGCRVQNILTNNMLVKHILNLILIYFAINLTSGDVLEHPYVVMRRSILVWVGFILFSRMNIYITTVVFILLTLGYTLGNFISYYQQENNKKEENRLHKIQSRIFDVIPVVILIGFILYYKEKYGEYNEIWSPITFLLGNTTCKNN